MLFFACKQSEHTQKFWELAPENFWVCERAHDRATKSRGGERCEAVLARNFFSIFSFRG